MTASAAATTCLTPLHVALDARMMDFGGYQMPLQYEGILTEHNACRQGAAIFDTAHMGELGLAGPNAVHDLERLVSCRIDTLREGRCRYGLLCNPEGGVIDDLIVYRLGSDEFMLVVNAGTRQGDVAWIAANLSSDTILEDRSDDVAKVDLQGPDAPRMARELLGDAMAGLPYFGFATVDFGGASAVVSRTGYTGEAGIEFYGAPDQVVAFWHAAVGQGARPAGLGARDTLRLELGLPLHGHELAPDRNAATCGLDWAMDADKAFIGAAAIRNATRDVARVGLVLEGRRAGRAGDTVYVEDRPVGVVTSGSYGPSVGKAIALADVNVDTVRAGVSVTVGRAGLPATMQNLPFWTEGTARRSWT